MYCPNCGMRNEDGIPYCKCCGASLQTLPDNSAADIPADASASRPYAQKRLPNTAWILFLVGFAALVVLLPILLHATKEKKGGGDDPGKAQVAELAVLAYYRGNFEQFDRLSAVDFKNVASVLYGVPLESGSQTDRPESSGIGDQGDLARDDPHDDPGFSDSASQQALETFRKNWISSRKRAFSPPSDDEYITLVVKVKEIASGDQNEQELERFKSSRFLPKYAVRFRDVADTSEWKNLVVYEYTVRTNTGLGDNDFCESGCVYVVQANGRWKLLAITEDGY